MAQADKKKKSWTPHDLIHIQPLNEKQEQAFNAWREGLNPVLVGSAGTGKTLLGLYFALSELADKNADEIIIIRSAVSTRDLGFLPGTKEEKSDSYEDPYYEMFDEICKFSNTYRHLKIAGKARFTTSSFLRGVTFHNAVIVVDEIQNMSQHEINSIVTRLDDTCSIILCGDTAQCDLNPRKEQSGFSRSVNLLKYMPDYFKVIEFDSTDIVRGELVKQWIQLNEAIHD